MERVVLAFAKEETALKVKKMLDGSGYEILTICYSVSEIARLTSSGEEFLLIMSYKLRDGTLDDVLNDLPRMYQIMVLIKAEYCEYIQNSSVFVVPLPIHRSELLQSVEMLAGSIALRRKKRGRSEDEQKIIKAAKLKLMDEHGMTEDSAHRFIQKRSMDTGAKFVDTARMILNS